MQVLEAFATVRDGGGFMSPSICRKVLEHFHAPRPAGSAAYLLSARELDLLQMARRGKRPKEIARDRSSREHVTRGLARSADGWIRVSAMESGDSPQLS